MVAPCSGPHKPAVESNAVFCFKISIFVKQAKVCGVVGVVCWKARNSGDVDLVWEGEGGEDKMGWFLGVEKRGGSLDVWSTYQFVLERTDESDTSSCYSADLRRNMGTMSLEKAFF